MFGAARLRRVDRVAAAGEGLHAVVRRRRRTLDMTINSSPARARRTEVLRARFNAPSWRRPGEPRAASPRTGCRCRAAAAPDRRGRRGSRSRTRAATTPSRRRRRGRRPAVEADADPRQERYRIAADEGAVGRQVADEAGGDLAEQRLVGGDAAVHRLDRGMERDRRLSDGLDHRGQVDGDAARATVLLGHVPPIIRREASRRRAFDDDGRGPGSLTTHGVCLALQLAFLAARCPASC